MAHGAPLVDVGEGGWAPADLDDREAALGRCPGGVDSDDNWDDFPLLASPTPGAANDCGNPLPVTCVDHCAVCDNGTTCDTCSNGYTWGGGDCQQDCDVGPNDPSNGSHDPCLDVPHGGFCALTCAAGYHADGDSKAECSDGAWASVDACAPSPCASSPDDPSNGAYASCGGTAHGGTCALTCGVGSYESDDGVADCTLGGWTGGDTCEACESYCDDCTDSTTCTACSVTYFLDDKLTLFQLGADIDGESDGDDSGSAISLSGDRIAIGASLNGGGGLKAGHVRVYEWGGSTWTQLGADIDGDSIYERTGRSLSLSGDRVAIGAPDSDGGGSSKGQVRVYEWSGSAWAQLGADINGEKHFDEAGTSVSLSGDRLAVGAAYNSEDLERAGHVRVFEWNGSAWAQLGEDIDGQAEEEWSGFSVSLSGDRLAIGAPGFEGGGTDRGHARVYEWSGSAWTQLGADIDGNGEADYDDFGHSVSLFGDRVAVGAPRNNAGGPERGLVRVYEWSGSSWSQLGGDIEGEANDDASGSSVSLSSDRLAIGAPYNSGGGHRSGHVRVYEWTHSGWMQLDVDIDGAGGGSRLGSSVSLSGDRVAAGAPWGTSHGLTSIWELGIDGDQCSACEAHCDVCSDADTCTDCSSGYTASGGDCGLDCTSAPTDPSNGTYAICNPTDHGGTCALTCGDGTVPSQDGLAECDDESWINGDVCGVEVSLDTDRSSYAGGVSVLVANYAFWQPITFDSVVNVTGFGVDFAYDDSCQVCHFGLYSDLNGEPESLLGGAIGDCSAVPGGTNYVSSAAGFQLDASTYWVYANFSQCGGNFRISSGGPGALVTTYGEAQQTSSGLPNPANVSSNADVRGMAYWPIGF